MWETGNIRDAHTILADPSLDENAAQRRLAVFWQKWMYAGLLEVVTRKKVHSSYLTRTSGNGERMLDSRNLIFALGACKESARQWEHEEKAKGLEAARRCCAAKVTYLFDILHVGDSPTADGSYRAFSVDHFPMLYDLMKAIAPFIMTLAEAIRQALYTVGGV